MCEQTQGCPIVERVLSLKNRAVLMMTSSVAFVNESDIGNLRVM